MRKFITTLLLIPTLLSATPTSLYWTNVTTEIQSTGMLHFGSNDFFSVENRRYRSQRFPTDLGLTYGAFEYNNVKCEIGVDYFAATDDPWYFNTKLGIEQDILFCGAPSFSIGIYNVGTRHKTLWGRSYCTNLSSRTDQNIVYLNVGRELFSNFYLYAGYYHINKAFGTPQSFQTGFSYSFLKQTHCDKREYFRWFIVGDWASGNNIQSGGGVGIVHNFTPDINLLTGPVFFNSAKFNGSWKWTVQLNITMDLLGQGQSGATNTPEN